MEPIHHGLYNPAGCTEYKLKQSDDPHKSTFVPSEHRRSGTHCQLLLPWGFFFGMKRWLIKCIAKLGVAFLFKLVDLTVRSLFSRTKAPLGRPYSNQSQRASGATLMYLVP